MLTVKLTTGELIQHVDWKVLPKNVVIRYMEFKIGDKSIRLMGYERYTRLKEIVQGVGTSLQGISKIILVGQNGVMCDKITLDMITKKINKEQVLFTEIYNGKPINESYWRPGQVSDNPNVFVKSND
jgi:hypothetical protein